MSLANLLKIGRLKAHAPDRTEIRRLLAAALAECRRQADLLYAHVLAWFAREHADLCGGDPP